jgi:shikimate dehydrogenase
VIRGTTKVIAHMGDPIAPVKSPMIYNPYFDKHNIDAVVVPMGVRVEDYPNYLRTIFRLTNICGALVTMPHKVTTVGLLERVTKAVRVAGSCNAVRLGTDGKLEGDMFDGAGFVRGVERKGRKLAGARALVVGAGGVGCAIAASLAGANVSAMGLFDMSAKAADDLAGRLRENYPNLEVKTGSTDPTGYDVVVNATPLGMKETDPLPLDVTKLKSSMFVGEVVMKVTITPLLRAAQEKGCPIQIGTDMLFEQIPAYLEYFGLPTTTADELRAVARLD